MTHTLLTALFFQAGNGGPGSKVPVWVALIAALAAPTVAAIALYYTNRREAKRLQAEEDRETERRVAEERREAERLAAEERREAKRLEVEAQREAERLSHEKEMKNVDLAHNRQLEERKERLEVYLKLVLAARTLGVMEKLDPDEPGGRSDLAEAFAEIQLVTHTAQVLSAANDLAEACVEARRRAASAHDAEIPDVNGDPEVEEAIEKAQNQRRRFIEAAKEEVGLPAIEEDKKYLLES